MKLKNLDNFYKEIQTIDIRFKNIAGEVQAIDLSHYSQFTSNYDNELKEQRELALSVLLLLGTEQIQFHANRLQLIAERFELFWEWYSAELRKFSENNFYPSEFMYYLATYLTIRNQRREIYDSWSYTSDAFLYELGDAVMYKQGQTSHLLYNIKSVTGVVPKLTGNSKERAEEEDKLTNHNISYVWVDKDAETELPKLYSALCSQYITQTDLASFQAVFSGRKIGTFQPIRWSGNASELIYFILSLMPGLVIDERKRMNWQKLKECFVKSDGSLFKEDFKNLKKGLETDLADSKKKQIDGLLYQFL